MIRPGLQPGKLQLAQPLAARSLWYDDREAPGDFLAQIEAAPAYHLVELGIGAGDNQFAQFRHLGETCPRFRLAKPDGMARRGLCQFRGCPGWLARHQTIDAALVVTMHPVAQGLAVHARLASGIKPQCPLEGDRDRQRPAGMGHIAALWPQTHETEGAWV